MQDYLANVLSTLPDKPMLRVNEVMDFLRCSKAKIYRLYESKELKGTKVGGSLRIYRISVVELVHNGNGKMTIDETEAEVEKKFNEITKAPRRQISSGL